MLVGCASNKATFAAQTRSLPAAETVVPGREPQPDVRRTDDLSTIANRYRAAFDRANCRIEIADANYRAVAAALAQKNAAASLVRGQPKTAVTECDKLRTMMQIETKTRQSGASR